MKVLWAANYSTQSAYSLQSRMLVPRITGMGHRVDVAELGALGLPRTDGHGIQVLPMVQDPLGNDILHKYFHEMHFDVLITLTDVWAFRADTMKQVRWFPHLPIDHDPVPPAVKTVLAQSGVVNPIAMSRYGEQKLREAGYKPLYMPHGFDGQTFYPVDQQEARRQLNIPAEAFWAMFIGVNDSTPSRKGIDQLLLAWSMFRQQVPDALLYLHTRATGNLAVNGIGGVNIPALMSTLGIPEKSVVLVDEFKYNTGITASHLNLLYNAADVVILPTRGEGFGVPMIEAAACGVPTITTPFAATGELCPAGWFLEYETVWDWQNALVAHVGVQSIVDRLTEAYQHRGDLRLRQTCYEWAQEYEIDHVFKTYTAPVMTAISEAVLEGYRG